LAHSSSKRRIGLRRRDILDDNDSRSRGGLKFTIVAFNHPVDTKSVLYRQNLSEDNLVFAIRAAVTKGANLFSIRAFKEEKD